MEVRVCRLLEWVQLMVLLLVIGFVVRVVLGRGGALGVVGLLQLPNNLFRMCFVRYDRLSW